MKLIKKDAFIILDKPLKITLTDILLPFGIENKYNNYISKLSLNNENYLMFKKIEDDIIENLIDMDNKYQLKSEIYKYKNYKSLKSKILLIKNNIITEIIDNKSNIIGIDEIKVKNRVNLILLLDKLWINDNDIVFYNWKILYIKKLND